MEKLEKRAERFGIDKEEQPVTQNEIDFLYKSLGIETENLHSSKLKNIRLEALHMRGVEDMSTEEIFKYFEAFGPASVEWINDFSCNVIWLDESTTARALLARSEPNVLKKASKLDNTDSLKVATDSTTSGKQISESEDSDTATITNEVRMDVDALVPCDTENSNSELFVKDTTSLNVPVPPGQWRLGLPHRKAKAILLRFATKDDKKQPGAEKRSQYYKKYGNPNYNGLKGIITSSKKRKINAERNKQTICSLTEDSSSHLDCNSGENTNRPVSYRSQVKLPKMRMYADDEEKKNNSSGRNNSEGNIFSRLGTRYTKSDLFNLGKKFSSSESEQEEDDTEINCTVPARYSVWTSIAKSMAKEDGYKSKAKAHDCMSQDLQSYKEFRSTFEEQSSHKRKNPRPLQTEDLRCKIKRLKEDHEEKSVFKHRSPLCKDA